MGRGTTLGVYLKAISSSGSLLLLLLLHFHEGIITGASAAFPSTKTQQKCDKVVSVKTPELLSYLGNVTFSAPIPFQGRWTTLIKFTSPFTFIGGWGVEVESFGRKGYAVFKRNDEENIQEGDQVIFQFRVLYGLNAKVPKVLSIRWENSSICGPPILDSTNQNINPSQNSATNSEDDDEDAGSSSIQTSSEEIEQHIATNNVRLNNWKEFAKKDE